VAFLGRMPWGDGEGSNCAADHFWGVRSPRSEGGGLNVSPEVALEAWFKTGSEEQTGRRGSGRGVTDLHSNLHRINPLPQRQLRHYCAGEALRAGGAASRGNCSLPLNHAALEGPLVS
jgi:hypothetical protein